MKSKMVRLPRSAKHCGQAKNFPDASFRHSRDLPTDNKLAASPRKKFCNKSHSLRSAEERTSQPSVPTAHLGGEGLGASRPDSINVGRIGPVPSTFVPRDLEDRDELLCSTGVSLFTDLGVSETVGFGIGTLSTSGSRVFVDCDPDPSFDPPAARTPAARISSRVSLEGADFFSRDLDLRDAGAGVGDSEASCSEGSGVCLERPDFFSRATITSCACTSPIRMMPQSTAQKNRFSMMPPKIQPIHNPSFMRRCCRIQPGGRCCT